MWVRKRCGKEFVFLLLSEMLPDSSGMIDAGNCTISTYQFFLYSDCVRGNVVVKRLVRHDVKLHQSEIACMGFKASEKRKQE